MGVYVINIRKAEFHGEIESSFFHLNPKILAKLFNLIYYLILTPTLTLTPQLITENPHIKYAPMNIAQCSFSLGNIIFSGKIVTS